MEVFLKGREVSDKEAAGVGVKFAYDLNKIDFRKNASPKKSCTK